MSSAKDFSADKKPRGFSRFNFRLSLLSGGKRKEPYPHPDLSELGKKEWLWLNRHLNGPRPPNPVLRKLMEEYDEETVRAAFAKRSAERAAHGKAGGGRQTRDV